MKESGDHFSALPSGVARPERERGKRELLKIKLALSSVFFFFFFFRAPMPINPER